MFEKANIFAEKVRTKVRAEYKQCSYAVISYLTVLLCM